MLTFARLGAAYLGVMLVLSLGPLPARAQTPPAATDVYGPQVPRLIGGLCAVPKINNRGQTVLMWGCYKTCLQLQHPYELVPATCGTSHGRFGHETTF